MDEYDESALPRRLFQDGYAPTDGSRINIYFNLRWLQDITAALETEDLEMLQESQFGKLLQMGHHTFSVSFVHYILCRQLVTNKEYELWWLYAGKPIRYSIRDFALVTGLNCKKHDVSSIKSKNRRKGKGKVSGGARDGELWLQLFGKQQSVTTSFIYQKLLLGKRYRDPTTRLRLVLLLLAHGFCCPTSGSTAIKEEHVAFVEDIDAFLDYPWGRKSFEQTVSTAKAVDPSKFTQDTLTISGFSHAFQLVHVVACPAIVNNPILVRTIGEEEGSIEAIAQCVAEINLMVVVKRARELDKKGEVFVQSCIADAATENTDDLDFDEEEDDPAVDCMMGLIKAGFHFEHNLWLGGVKAADFPPTKTKKKKILPDVVLSSDAEEDSDDQPLLRRRQPGGKKAASAKPNRGASSHAPPATNQQTGNISISAQELKVLLDENFENYVSRTTELLEAYSTSVTNNFHQIARTFVDELKGSQHSNRRKQSTESSRQDGDSNQREPSFHTGETSVHEDQIFHTNIHEPEDVGGASREDNDFVVDLVTQINEEEDAGTDVISLDGNDASEHEFRFGEETEDVHGPLGPAQGTEVHGNALALRASSSSHPPDFVIQTPSFNLNLTPELRRCLNIQIPKHIKVPSFDLRLTQMFSPSQGAMVPLQQQALPLEPEQQSKSQKTITYKRSRKPPARAPVATAPPDSPRRSGRNKKGPKVYTPPTIPRSNRKRAAPATLPKEPVQAPKRRKIPVHTLIAKFNPFTTPKQHASEGFLKAIAAHKTFKVGQSIVVENSVFLRLFDGQEILHPTDMDLLITFVQRRRDTNLSHKFDFLPTSFLSELKRQYERFKNFEKKDEFYFSSLARVPFQLRPRWFAKVDIIYCPLTLEGRHWVGLVIDLNAWTITVLDCSPSRNSFSTLEDSIMPIAIVLPYLIRNHLQQSSGPSTTSRAPFAIQRLEVQLNVNDDGLLGVATLVLLEEHAVGRIEENSLVNKEMLHIAAENYAIECFRVLKPIPCAP